MNRTILTSPAVSFYPNGRFPTHSSPAIHNLSPCSALERHYGQCFARSTDTQALRVTPWHWFTALLSRCCGTPSSGMNVDDLPGTSAKPPAPCADDEADRNAARSVPVEPGKHPSDSTSASGKRLYNIADVW